MSFSLISFISIQKLHIPGYMLMGNIDNNINKEYFLNPNDKNILNNASILKL